MTLADALSLQVIAGMLITLLGTAIATRLIRLRRRARVPQAPPPPG